MITLYSFGRAFGLSDPSPFVSKVEILLKMANLPDKMNTKGSGIQRAVTFDVLYKVG